MRKVIGIMVWALVLTTLAVGASQATNGTPVGAYGTFLERNDSLCEVATDKVSNLFSLTNTCGTGSGVEIGSVLINLTGSHDGCFFDTVYTGWLNKWGLSHDFKPESLDGVTIDGAVVTDGGKTLAIDFSGFTPGKKVDFSIDVDESHWTVLDSLSYVRGCEFQGSTLTAVFRGSGITSTTLSGVYNEKCFASADTYLNGCAQPVPEPGTMVALLSGLGGLGGMVMRRKRS